MSNRNLYRGTRDVSRKLRENIHDRKFVQMVKVLTRMPHNDPTEQELRNQLTHVKRIYTMGDKLYKFAHEYYGDPNLWWVIAWYNNKPTDAHFKLGETVYIPRELEVAINIAMREQG